VYGRNVLEMCILFNIPVAFAEPPRKVHTDTPPGVSQDHVRTAAIKNASADAKNQTLLKVLGMQGVKQSFKQSQFAKKLNLTKYDDGARFRRDNKLR